jgi:hypothetical protein
MTLTYLHDAGTWEGFDKTIAARLSASWNSANTNTETPKFYSASGNNVSHSWTRGFGTNEVHLNEDIGQQTVLDENSNTMKGFRTVVFIDIFARDASLLKLFIREVNRVLWDVLSPDSGNRLKKSNGTDNSPIDHFEGETIEFRKNRLTFSNMKLQPHANGELKVVWYVFKT